MRDRKKMNNRKIEKMRSLKIHSSRGLYGTVSSKVWVSVREGEGEGEWEKKVNKKRKIQKNSKL